MTFKFPIFPATLVASRKEMSGGKRRRIMTNAATMPIVMIPICRRCVLLTASVPPVVV